MTVCKFWLEGRCRYGNDCKFDHPPRPSGGQSGFRGQTQDQNRFAAFQGGNSGNRPSGNASGGRGDMKRYPFQLDPDTLTDDLFYSHPQWILSAYGPGRDAAIQLFGGDMREQSFEEMRLYHYQESAAGRQQQAMQKADSLVNEASQQMQKALRDLDGAINYIIEGEKQHPNRRDICAQSVLNNQGGQPWNTSRGGFGQQSTQLQTASTTFGQPSQLLQQPNAFGQPSQLAGNTFSGGFAPLGQSAGGPFAQPAQPQATPFGQPQSGTLGFGQPQDTAPAFGQPSIPQGPSFGQPSQPAPFSAAGGFGNPSAPATNQLANNNVPTNPFNQLRQATVNSSSPSVSSPSDMTGQPTGSSGYSRTSGESNLGTSSSSSWTTNSSYNPQDIGSYSTRDPTTRRLLTWKGKRVEYVDNEPCFRRDDDGKLERIWFPDGPPNPNPDTELPIEMYDERTKEAYLYCKQHGVWKDGRMPSLPPRQEWVRWDF